MLGCIYSLFFLSFFLILSRKRGRNSNVFIFSIWYIMILLDYSFYQPQLVPFSKKFDSFFLFFCILYIFSYLLFNTVFHYSKLSNIRLIKTNILTYDTYFFLCTCLTLFSFISFLTYMKMYSFSIFREMIAGGDLSTHVGISFPFICTLIYYQNIYNIKKYRKLTVLQLFLLMCIATSKMFFVLGLLYLIPWYKKEFKIKISYILLIVIGGILFFALVHILTNRVVGSGNIFNKVFYMFNGYLLGGIAIFQTHLDGTLANHVTVHPWVRVGKWVGNVYSGFYSFYHDYSYSIFALKTVSIGFLYALLNCKSIICGFIKIYAIYPFLFFIFSDLFYPSVKQWIIFIIAGVAISCINDGGKKCVFVA